VEKGVAGACSVLGPGRYKSNTPPLFLCSHTCLLPLPRLLSSCHPIDSDCLTIASIHIQHPTFVSSPCGKSPLPHYGKLPKLRGSSAHEANDAVYSGIFGYINYLVEKDRKYIIDTLINGKQTQQPLPQTRVPRNRNRKWFGGAVRSSLTRLLPQVCNV
jgi:hypothetical protein